MLSIALECPGDVRQNALLRRRQARRSLSAVLLTGASGRIGAEVARELREKFELISIARSERSIQGVRCVLGDFTDPRDLRRLDGLEIGALVHLAAQTGGDGERDALRVNADGTHRLIAYLANRGCRRFILASSIAAIGCLDRGFVPVQVPISEEHPILARDPYGLSKSLMEQVGRYWQIHTPDSEVVVFRIGVVIGPGDLDLSRSGPARPFADLAHIHVDDVTAAIDVGLSRTRPHAYRLLNLVGPEASGALPVAATIRAALGDRAAHLDFSTYERAGNEYAPVYDMSRLYSELNFHPNVLLRVRD